MKPSSSRADPPLEWFFGVHSLLIWVLVAAVALHVLGALKHWLIDRDQVLQRMGWGKKRPR